MNLLIVDDDQYIIDGIRSGVEWSRLPITNIYYATSAREARELMSSVLIHLLLCDIEMPRETGLDLLAWVRAQGMNVSCIFLTGYADFHYAQRALSLGSIEYFLKPIQYDALLKILQKACDQIETLEQERYLQLLGKYWEESSKQRKEFFWTSLLAHRQAPPLSDVRRCLTANRLEYNLSDQFVLAGLCLLHSNAKDLRLIERMQQYQVENAAACLTTEDGSLKTEAVWQESSDMYYIVVCTTLSEDALNSALRQRGKKLLNGLERHEIEGVLHFAEPSDLEHAYEQSKEIRQMVFHNLLAHEGIFFQKDFLQAEDADDPFFPQEQLDELLLRRDAEAVERLINQTLRSIEERKVLVTDAYHHTIARWQQSVYSYLYKNQIEADLLFANETYRELYGTAQRNVTGVAAYLRYLTAQTLQSTERTRESSDIITSIKAYIDQNLSQNITRATLSSVVFMNPDYLAQLFKRSTGITILKYINNERLRHACELLMQTDKTVYAIAEECGFQTSSYFAKQFKEKYGIGPNEYRRAAHAPNDMLQNGDTGREDS